MRILITAYWDIEQVVILSFTEKWKQAKLKLLEYCMGEWI